MPEIGLEAYRKWFMSQDMTEMFMRAYGVVGYAPEPPKPKHDPRRESKTRFVQRVLDMRLMG